jgi:hypothetical protein
LAIPGLTIAAGLLAVARLTIARLTIDRIAVLVVPRRLLLGSVTRRIFGLSVAVAGQRKEHGQRPEHGS